jgi:hypothetical protein
MYTDASNLCDLLLECMPLEGVNAFRETQECMKIIKINAGGREGVGRFTGLPLWTGWVGREVICLLFFPLLLQLAFVFPGIVVGTQGFVYCVYCVGGACCIVSFF